MFMLHLSSFETERGNRFTVLSNESSSSMLITVLSNGTYNNGQSPHTKKTYLGRASWHDPSYQRVLAKNRFTARRSSGPCDENGVWSSIPQCCETSTKWEENTTKWDLKYQNGKTIDGGPCLWENMFRPWYTWVVSEYRVYHLRFSC